MGNFVNFIVGGMLGYWVVRKMTDSQNYSSGHNDIKHNHSRQHNGQPVNYAHE